MLLYVILKPCTILKQHIPYLFFRNKELPQHFRIPSAMMAILSPRRSASSMKCVVRSIVRPALFFWRTVQICRLASGSNPDDGSSRITIYNKKKIMNYNTINAYHQNYKSLYYTSQYIVHVSKSLSWVKYNIINWPTTYHMSIMSQVHTVHHMNQILHVLLQYMYEKCIKCIFICNALHLIFLANILHL